MSENSCAAFARIFGSAQTPVRAPVGWKRRSPAARAIRYGGTGLSITNRQSDESGQFTALISAFNPEGTLTRASQVTRTPGESCSGIQLRAWIACDCVYRNGWSLPSVCSGASHCSADAPLGLVEYRMRTNLVFGAI